MEDKYFVNIGRQLGSGGREIGERLAARLGIAFYDKELLRLAAQESGLHPEFFEKADERANKLRMGGLFGLRFTLGNHAMSPYDNCLSNDALFRVQSDVIRHLAEKESCLFVGRCADYILREQPHCINIFITANRADRVRRLCLLHPEMTESQAADMINRMDRRRATYYNYYTNRQWGVASSYHLCIESSPLGVDRTVDLLEQFIRAKLEQDAHRKA